MPIRLTFALALLYHTPVQAGRVLLTLYALNFDAGQFAVGVLAAMFSALPMLLSWQVGRLVDRFGARWPLMFGGLCGALGMLAPYLCPGIPALYLAAVMTGLLFAFCAAPLQTLVGLLSRPVDSARQPLEGACFTFAVAAAALRRQEVERSSNRAP
jgi:MFS family permease